VFPVLFCWLLSVMWLAVKTAREMTCVWWSRCISIKETWVSLAARVDVDKKKCYVENESGMTAENGTYFKMFVGAKTCRLLRM